MRLKLCFLLFLSISCVLVFTGIPRAVAEEERLAWGQVVFVSPKRSSHTVNVEIARTPRQQEHGLMYRRALPVGQGMLFPYEPPREVAFWMKNTLIPLDMLFIGPNARIVQITAQAKPNDETPILSPGKVTAVVELAGGMAARWGLQPGDKVEIRTANPPEKPLSATP